MKTLFENRKIKFKYTILESWIAGVELMGSEVKNIKSKNSNLVGAWCELKNLECICHDWHIKESESSYSHLDKRDKRLLLNKRELLKISKMMVEGTTIVPVSVLLSDNGLIKLKIALVKGKTKYDKRNSIKQRDLDSECREYK